jgi:hypothetical protein
MTRKLGIGVLAAALLMSGALVGVSFGGGGGITQPEVIELSVAICGRKGACHHYPLREGDGRQTGQVSMIKDPLLDVDGNQIGHINIFCSVANARQTNWVCTNVLTLKAGDHTERGTVVTTGIAVGRGPGPTETFAVTGGTGAYENVRGFAIQDDEQNLYTLHLIP